MRIEGVPNRKGGYEELVSWLEIKDHDCTWEPFKSMIDDVPGLLED